MTMKASPRWDLTHTPSTRSFRDTRRGDQTLPAADEVSAGAEDAAAPRGARRTPNLGLFFKFAKELAAAARWGSSASSSPRPCLRASKHHLIQSHPLTSEIT